MRPRKPAGLVCFAAVIFSMLCSAGCGEIRWISEYDRYTDERLGAIHRDVESLLIDLEVDLGTPDGDYARFEERYNGLRVDLRTLQVRAEARPKNDIQVEQLGIVIEQIDMISEAHRQGMQPEEVEPFRRGFEQSFLAMIRLELAKKRGEDID